MLASLKSMFEFNPLLVFIPQTAPHLTALSGQITEALRLSNGQYIDNFDNAKGKTSTVRILAIVRGHSGNQYLCPISDSGVTTLRPLVIEQDGQVHLLAEAFRASIDNSASEWNHGVLTAMDPVTVIGYTIVRPGPEDKPNKVKDCDILSQLEIIKPANVVSVTPQPAPAVAAPATVETKDQSKS
jgi:hypothetical protein